jgi:hypothetical protein
LISSWNSGREVVPLRLERGSLGNKDAEQAEYLVKLAGQLRATPDVEAMFVDELLDEPYFGPNNPESHYGLVELLRGSDGHWQIGPRKPAFEALRAAIGDAARQGEQRCGRVQEAPPQKRIQVGGSLKDMGDEATPRERDGSGDGSKSPRGRPTPVMPAKWV